jgi:hypothetical protein
MYYTRVHPLETKEFTPSTFLRTRVRRKIVFKAFDKAMTSVSIVSHYRLDGRTNGVRCTAEVNDFSSILRVQTRTEANAASYPVGTGGPFPVGKARPGRDAGHYIYLVPRSRMIRLYTSTHLVACMAVARQTYFICQS